MNGLIKRGLICIVLLWSCIAAAEVTIPSLSARVTDLTDTLTANQKAKVEQSLANFEAQKGAQIAVLIVSTTAPESIEQYSLRVVEAWKLGRKKIDDGALLIIAKEDRTLRIEVGYGLEGALNDAVSKRIISDIIVPYFKQGDYYGGIEAGINSMMKVISGEPLPGPASAAETKPIDQTFLPLIFIIVVAIGGLLRVLLGRLLGSVVTGFATTLLAWVVMGVFSFALFAGVVALIITLLSGGARSINRRPYGGGFGGAGRGGSGGFGGGGGGFGGGGASGRW